MQESNHTQNSMFLLLNYILKTYTGTNRVEDLGFSYRTNVLTISVHFKRLYHTEAFSKVNNTINVLE